jgi:hypothetical protein
MARLVRQIWGFLKTEGKWWLLPIVLAFVVVGALAIAAEISPLLPFIYPLI